MGRQLDAGSIFISAFYAKFLVILGIALPVTNAIIGASPRKIDGFYIFLNSMSVLFLTYCYVIYMKEKKFQRLNKKKNQYLNDGAQQIRHGSFYLHLGVVAFGMISVIHSSLQFGQYFEMTKKCSDLLIAALPMTKVVFVMQQMIFIFSWSQQMKKYEHLALRRFGIMHLIATNLCVWLRNIIEETKFDIFNANQKTIANINGSEISKQLLDENDDDFQNFTLDFYKFSWEHDTNSPDCYSSNIMKPLLRNANPYLSPCAVEYSLLCIVILVTMWKNICSIPYSKQKLSEMTVSKRQQRKRSIINCEEPLNKFYIDCVNAQKGLLLALILFSGTIISLIMFFELAKSPKFLDVAVSQVNIWEMTLFSSSTAVLLIFLAAIKKARAYKNQEKELHSEHVLLYVTQFGVYLYSLFQVIGYYFLIMENSAVPKILRIASPMCAVIESSCQTLLITEAWRRHLKKNKQKASRQLITLLIMSNISLWIINRVKNNRAEFHPLQMEFYGVWAWTIITHIAMPMVVCYRFQSTICFYEMWKIINDDTEIEKCDNTVDLKEIIEKTAA